MNSFLHTLHHRLILTTFLLSYGVAFAGETISKKSGSNTTAFLELYTSEGCSSCPPADRWISSLKPHIDKELKLVPLAFHVDYWNYLGWEDAYSSPEYSKRQRQLGNKNRQSSIYTPGFYLNTDEIRGVRRMLDNIQKLNKERSPWSLEITAQKKSADSVQVKLQGQLEKQMSAAKADVFLALYENSIVREIGRGENTGKTLQHDFVVRQWLGPVKLRSENGQISLTRSITFPEDSVRQNTGIAAVLFDPDSGDSEQAIQLELGSLYSD